MSNRDYYNDVEVALDYFLNKNILTMQTYHVLNYHLPEMMGDFKLHHDINEKSLKEEIYAGTRVHSMVRDFLDSSQCESEM